MSSNDDARGRMLGVDPGRKRIGFALSDELGVIARPLEVWLCRSKQRDARRVAELARAHDVVAIVVGIARNLEDGSDSSSTRWARAFVEAIRAVMPDIPILERDEALTSWEAEHRLRAAGRTMGSGVPIDAYAAALILQDELDERARHRAHDQPENDPEKDSEKDPEGY
ncbi:MAG: Holliday junction resolvase RuvX [Deltaproteobacteria bacterium]|nr:Holliday junction resolvase RuvX [Deltaproteobacteria bacterium]